MKQSTKYLALVALGGISGLYGSYYMIDDARIRREELKSLTYKILASENRKSDLADKLEYCLAHNQDNCRTLFSEYRAVDAEYLSLKKESEKSDTPWLPFLVMMGGLALFSSSLTPYYKAQDKERNEKYKEESRKAAAEASKGIKIVKQ